MRNAKLATFSERLKQMVENSELKREEIAMRVGLAKETLSKYCSGTREPDIATVVALAEVLECDCNYLLTGRNAEYAEIANTLGLTQDAIKTVSDIKYGISDYAPCVYSKRIREKAANARKNGKDDDYEPDVCITNADVLNVALSDELFLKVLIDYLVCPDKFELDAGANLLYPLDNLKNGIVGVSADDLIQPIRTKVMAKDVANIALISVLSRVRENVQMSVEKTLSENGYKACASKLHGIKFREWRADNGRKTRE